MKVRTFFAVKVPEFPDIVALAQRLDENMDNLKVVDTSSLHVTLKFLGDIRADMLGGISQNVEDVLEGPPFKVKVKGTGKFGRKRKVSVLWLGIDDGDNLTPLAKRIDGEMVKMGFKPERRKFSPHLTIARVRSGFPRESLDLLDQCKEREFGEFIVDKVHFMKSILTPQGAVYDVISEICLE